MRNVDCSFNPELDLAGMLSENLQLSAHNSNFVRLKVNMRCNNAAVRFTVNNSLCVRASVGLADARSKFVTKMPNKTKRDQYS